MWVFDCLWFSLYTFYLFFRWIIAPTATWCQTSSLTALRRQIHPRPLAGLIQIWLLAGRRGRAESYGPMPSKSRGCWFRFMCVVSRSADRNYPSWQKPLPSGPTTRQNITLLLSGPRSAAPCSKISVLCTPLRLGEPVG